MENKILGILEGARNEDADALPIEREAIVKLLEAVPDDIKSEYAECMVSFANDFLTLRNIFLLDQSSLSFRHLIDNLNPFQIQSLATIARNMASRDPIDKMPEIIKNTFGFTHP